MSDEWCTVADDGVNTDTSKENASMGGRTAIKEVETFNEADIDVREEDHNDNLFFKDDRAEFGPRSEIRVCRYLRGLLESIESPARQSLADCIDRMDYVLEQSRSFLKNIRNKIVNP